MRVFKIQSIKKLPFHAVIGLVILASLFTSCMEISKDISDLDISTMYDAREQGDGYVEVQFIAIHTTGSNSKRELSGNDVMEVAKERGFRRPPYHFYVSRHNVYLLCPINKNLYLEPSEICWGVAGYNSRTVDICYEGCFVDRPASELGTMNTFQDTTIRRLVVSLQRQFPKAIVLGHNEFPKVKKICPGFKASKKYSDAINTFTY